MSGVMIGVPHLGPAAWPFVESLLSLKATNGYRFLRRGPLPVDMARNDLAQAFLDSDKDYLLLIDSDAVLHPLTLERLLSWDVPVVSVLAFMRNGPMMPTVFRDKREGFPGAFQTRMKEVHTFIEQHQELLTHKPVVLQPRPDGALFEVDRTGCHCVLIKRAVIETIQPPWFVSDPVTHAKEDFYFYEQVQAAGFPVYVDLSCMAAHLYGDRMLAAMDHLVWHASSEYEGDNVVSIEESI